MVLVMNALHYHKKVVTYLTKILKWLWYDTITKSEFTNNTLHERKCSTELLVFSKGVLKRTVILLDKLWNAVEGKIRYAAYQLML